LKAPFNKLHAHKTTVAFPAECASVYPYLCIYTTRIHVPKKKFYSVNNKSLSLTIQQK